MCKVCWNKTISHFNCLFDTLINLSCKSAKYFIDIVLYVDFCEEGKKSILVVNMKAAWNIEEQPYIEMSKKYNLDFRVYGYEMGMEFNKEIEIVEGEIATYRLIQFKDYKWECPDPKLGG